MSLAEIGTRELEALRSRIVRGEFDCPLSRELPSLAVLGRHAPALFGQTQAATLALIDSVLDERRAPRPLLDLVWTGPDGKGSRSRDTAVVVREMFAQATRSVLIAGYAFDHGSEILRPLHEVMRDRGVETDLFVDIPRADSADRADEMVMRHIDGLLRVNWPFGEPHPRIYYDPRTVWGDAYASLHAKCVVVDDQVTLVGSANFTGRGQDRNIEVGVRIEDASFSERLVYQWRQAVHMGRLVRCR